MKKITDYDYYFVDEYGRVYSSAKGGMNELTRIPMSHGYLSVSLSKNGRGTHTLVHRIVATAFLPNPEDKRTVNHKNGNKHDNRLDNLEWATYSENHKHSFRKLGRVSGTKGKRGLGCSNSKPVIQILMGDEGKEIFHGSAAEASRATGTNTTSLNRVCTGKQVTAGGHLWRFATKAEIKKEGGFVYA